LPGEKGKDYYEFCGWDESNECLLMSKKLWWDVEDAAMVGMEMIIANGANGRIWRMVFWGKDVDLGLGCGGKE